MQPCNQPAGLVHVPEDCEFISLDQMFTEPYDNCNKAVPGRLGGSFPQSFQGRRRRCGAIEGVRAVPTGSAEMMTSACAIGPSSVMVRSIRAR